MEVSWDYASAVLSLPGYSFGLRVPSVADETDVARFFRAASISDFVAPDDRDGMCDLEEYSWTYYTAYRNIHADYSSSNFSSEIRNYSIGRLVWDIDAQECVESNYDTPWTSRGFPVSVSSALGSSTFPDATHTSREVWFIEYVGKPDVHVTVVLSDEVTESDAISDWSPSTSTLSSSSIGTIREFEDGTFDIPTSSSLFPSVPSTVYEARAGFISNFSYASCSFWAKAKNLRKGADYRATLLIAKREALRSYSTGSFRGNWSVHATPTYTFTATDTEHDVITEASSYNLPITRGWEYRLIWAGVEKL
ncbi:hypothetical protein H5P28_11520 [Ruficoccus amylovorans]|uniref:Uncharacterized protein n=1 Tax=Ruficoccus amylovorans TaxID=1804625 RepID=A0A842HGY9_9BACT|nr:hypothetical protein [Ruficoccus amylovorans]MBC2594886.1 hypothetical protein [Ruficoccus amylovorans]